MKAPLRVRVFAEFLGTAALVAVVVGSGITAQRLSHDVGLELLENALATAAGLAVLIAVLAPVSGGHFNPVVSIADFANRRRHPEVAGASHRRTDTVWYVMAQIAGAIAGAVLTNAMFARALVEWSHHRRAWGHTFLGEVVATAGLVVVIFVLAGKGRTRELPWAVGAYIGAGYYFTSSTAFANPAVTIGRAFTSSFAGIAPASLWVFVSAQLLGGAVGFAISTVLLSERRGPREAVETPVPTLPASGDGSEESRWIT
jgi:glycerol uptake facilitator-like aquaporin